MPINELAARLGDSFIRCHRSYLVGLKHLSRITKSDVVLTCGTVIPLSRRLYADVNKVLIKWITA
jgi:DNA-binding LytR/AlgR family response regulator